MGAFRPASRIDGETRRRLYHEELAEEAVERMKSLPGFSDERNCFFIDEEPLGSVGWQEGFTSD
jgi:hypothetical protein